MTLTGGATTISAGTLAAGSTTAFGPAASAAIAFSPSATGTLSLNGKHHRCRLEHQRRLAGRGDVQAGTGAATLTVNNASANTYAGVFQKGGATSP